MINKNGNIRLLIKGPPFARLQNATKLILKDNLYSAVVKNPRWLTFPIKHTYIFMCILVSRKCLTFCKYAKRHVYPGYHEGHLRFKNRILKINLGKGLLSLKLICSEQLSKIIEVFRIINLHKSVILYLHHKESKSFILYS